MREYINWLQDEVKKYIKKIMEMEERDLIKSQEEENKDAK